LRLQEIWMDRGEEEQHSEFDIFI